MKKKQKTKGVIFGILGLTVALVANALEAPPDYAPQIPNAVNLVCEDHGETIEISLKKFSFFDRAGNEHIIHSANGLAEGAPVHGTFTEHPMPYGTRLTGEVAIDVQLSNPKVGKGLFVDAHLVTTGLYLPDLTGAFGSIDTHFQGADTNEYLVDCKLANAANY